MVNTRLELQTESGSSNHIRRYYMLYLPIYKTGFARLLWDISRIHR